MSDNIDILVAVEDSVEELLGRATHDTLSASTGVEDIERVNDVCKGDGLVTLDPLLVLIAVDDDHELVSGLRVRLEDDFVEGSHGEKT